MADETKKQKKDISNFEVTVPSDSDRKEYPALPELQYLTARLTSISEQPSKSGVRARFEYTLTGKYDGRKAWCSVPFHKVISGDTGFNQLIAQHLGVTKLEPGKYSGADIVGKAYEILITNSPSKKDPKKIYQNVTKVRPITAAALENVEIETGKKKPKTTRKSQIKKAAPEAAVVEEEADTENTNEASSEDEYEMPF